MNTTFKLTILVTLFLLSTVSYREKFQDSSVGWGFYTVMSNSMEPVIRKGSVVFVRAVSEVDVGDIVAFRYPLNLKRTITHRVVSIEDDEGQYFVTKGDANRTVDPWQLRMDIVKGKVVLSVPLVGYIVNFIRTPVGLFAAVIIPLGLLIVLESDEVYRELKAMCRSFSRRHRMDLLKLSRFIKQKSRSTLRLFLSKKQI